MKGIIFKTGLRSKGRREMRTQLHLVCYKAATITSKLYL